MKAVGLLLCVASVDGITAILIERPWAAANPWYFGSMTLVIVLVYLAMLGAVMVDDG